MLKKAVDIIKGVLVAMMFVSCQDTPFFTKYHSVPSHYWDKREMLVYDIPVVDEDKTVDVTLGIRTTEQFAYSNITLLSVVSSGKKEVLRDTVCVALFEDESAPLGNGFPFMETTKKLPSSLHLKKGKRYTIKVTHLMRMNPLDDVYDVGVTLE